MKERSLSISEFCEAEGFSRGFFYKLEKLGLGPRTYNIGPVCRITPESHAIWRKEREAASQTAGEAA